MAGNQVSTLKDFNQFISNDKTQEYLQSVLGNKKSSFVNNAVALVSNVKGLQKCDPQTTMFAAIKATALDLPLDNNLGFAYVIPYGNQAQFQMGYKGFIQLAMRSGQFERINVTDVREGELGKRDRLSGDIEYNWIDDESEREKAEIIGYVAYFKLKNGFEKQVYMSAEETRGHGKKYSKTFNNGQWKDNFDGMSRKTVLKQLLSKYAPLSVEMAEAVKADQAIITEEGEYIYADKVVAEVSAEEQAAQTAKANELLGVSEAPVQEPETEEYIPEFLIDEEK
ncbi:recombinase RecT [Culicoidibacter larvae]|uniref:Recombinase RecT n=1 Tax=Culicoidibacter larvae TaxID=2579976 RepID=A0A5R8Q8N0_9FIRM|nr:recombinase RecT [Culicoidibacter larvae]TLG72072.1 recombinase RecT [Culicoidibacter larvae]